MIITTNPPIKPQMIVCPVWPIPGAAINAPASVAINAMTPPIKAPLTFESNLLYHWLIHCQAIIPMTNVMSTAMIPLCTIGFKL